MNIKTQWGYGFKYPHPEKFPSSRIRGIRFAYENNSVTRYDRHLKNVDGNSFGWVSPHLLHSFGNFCSCST